MVVTLDRNKRSTAYGSDIWIHAFVWQKGSGSCYAQAKGNPRATKAKGKVARSTRIDPVAYGGVEVMRNFFLDIEVREAK